MAQFHCRVTYSWHPKFIASAGPLAASLFSTERVESIGGVPYEGGGIS